MEYQPLPEDDYLVIVGEAEYIHVPPRGNPAVKVSCIINAGEYRGRCIKTQFVLRYDEPRLIPIWKRNIEAFGVDCYQGTDKTTECMFAAQAVFRVGIFEYPKGLNPIAYRNDIRRVSPASTYRWGGQFI